MNILNWLVLFVGLGIFIVLVQQRFRVRRQEKIITRQQSGNQKKVFSTIDYQELMIRNSRWLTMLDNLEKQLSTKLLIFGGIGLMLLLMTLTGVIALNMNDLAMLLMLVLIAIIILPGIILKSAIKTRLKMMMDALPYFIDLTAVCVQSGMTVESALKYIGERFDKLDGNLASLILQVIKRAEVSGLEDALAELYRSMNIAEIRMFCSTLQQSVHYGTSIYENLMELSKDIRELQILNTEEKVGKLAARMSVPLILFIMFPITVLIAAPGILRIMQNGLF